MEKPLFVILTFLISAIIGWITIPRIVIISKIKRLFDKPDERKVHKESIPRLGGVSFFPAMMVSVSMMLGFRYYVNLALPLPTEVLFISEFLFLLSGMFILFFIGLTDDLVGVGYRYKFLAQTMAASLIIFTGIMPTDMQGLLMLHQIPTWVAYTVTVLFIIFIVNAYNLIDGVDGLCSGLSSITLLSLGAWFIYIDLYVYAMIAFGMLGVVITFFKYNITGNRLKVFMGDTGSLTLGFLIIFLSLKFLQQSSLDVDSSYYHIKNPIALMVGLLFIPTFDTLRVFTSRLSRGKSPFHADKTHIHHKLLNMKMSHIQSTITLLCAQVVFLLLNILLSEVLALNINIVLLIDLILAVSINSCINRYIKLEAQASLKY